MIMILNAECVYKDIDNVFDYDCHDLLLDEFQSGSIGLQYITKLCYMMLLKRDKKIRHL